MATCEPIMVLLEDLELIDGIIEKRYKESGKDIFSRENRKELIAQRKAVIHQIIEEWQKK